MFDQVDESEREREEKKFPIEFHNWVLVKVPEESQSECHKNMFFIFAKKRIFYNAKGDKHLALDMLYDNARNASAHPPSFVSYVYDLGARKA